MSIERVQVTATKTYNKFVFSDYGFSHFVRDKMLQSLLEFDKDGDQCFDE